VPLSDIEMPGTDGCQPMRELAPAVSAGGPCRGGPDGCALTRGSACARTRGFQLHPPSPCRWITVFASGDPPSRWTAGSQTHAAAPRTTRSSSSSSLTPRSLCWVNPDGRLLWTNRACLELLGGSARARRPLHRRVLRRPRAVADCWTAFVAGRRSGATRRPAARDGAVRRVLIGATGLFRDRQFVHSRWVIRDVTALLEGSRPRGTARWTRAA